MSPSLLTSPRLRRALTGLVGVVAAACWVAGPADATLGGNPQSPAVVESAFWALAAHDTFSETGTPGD